MIKKIALFPRIKVNVDLLSQVTLHLCEEGFIFEGEGDKKSLSPYLQWMEAYSRKENILADLPFEALPTFSKKVLNKLQSIPFGKTISYKDLAHKVGSPRAARAIGNACRKNPFPLFIPCHRVVGSHSLGGYTPYIEIKKELLSFENSLT
jgi:O-6-methylguanine DNA methyltransferase